MVFLVLIVVLSATGIFGRIVNVVVEREVFERSYQYQEGKNAQIAKYEAEIASLKVKLRSPNLSVTMRSDMEAQLAALEIQLRAARDLQNR
jgi:hypothetical protein